MTLGERLKTLRAKKKLTQEAVAEQIGVSTISYIRYESDKSRPRKDEIYTKLAEVLGTSVEELRSSKPAKAVKGKKATKKTQKPPSARKTAKTSDGKKMVMTEEQALLNLREFRDYFKGLLASKDDALDKEQVKVDLETFEVAIRVLEERAEKP